MLQSTSTTSNQKGGASTATFTPAGTVGDWPLRIDQIPSHSHSLSVLKGFYFANNFNSASTGEWNRVQGTYSPGANGGSYDYDTNSTGSGNSHTHSFTGNQTTIDTVSPYITVYMYKRVS